MADFDIAGAIKAGYTPAEINDYLGQQSGFDVAGARQAGYADDEILQHFTPAPPKEQRGAVAEIGRQIVGGLVTRAPAMIGGALEWWAPQGSALEDAGRVAKEYWTEKEKAWEPDLEGRGFVSSTLIKGASQLGPSLAGMGAAMINPVLGGAAVATIFGGQQAQDTYDKGLKAGLSEADASEAAYKTGLIEGFGETVADVAGAKLLTGGGKLLSGLIGKQGMSGAIRAATDPRMAAQFARDWAANAVIQSGTEFGQGYGQAVVERDAGISTGDPLEQGAEGAQSALGMSLLLGPLAALGGRSAAKRRAMIGDALNDPTAPLPIRMAAGEYVAKDIEPAVGKEAAQSWLQSFHEAAVQDRDAQQQPTAAATGIAPPSGPAGLLGYQPGPPLVVFPDGSTMTGAEAERRRLDAMVQRATPADILAAPDIDTAIAAAADSVAAGSDLLAEIEASQVAPEPAAGPVEQPTQESANDALQGQKQDAEAAQEAVIPITAAPGITPPPFQAQPEPVAAAPNVAAQPAPPVSVQGLDETAVAAAPATPLPEDWASLNPMPARTDGTNDFVPAEGMTILHGSGNASLTAADVQIVRQNGQKQGKKGRTYGGLYGTSESDIAQAEGYASMMGGEATLYDIHIRPGTKILNKIGDITRLSENYINELVSQGYGVVVGKDPRGRTEYVVIDKSAIASMAQRAPKAATPKQLEMKARATRRNQEGTANVATPAQTQQVSAPLQDLPQAAPEAGALQDSLKVGAGATATPTQGEQNASQSNAVLGVPESTSLPAVEVADGADGRKGMQGQEAAAQVTPASVERAYTKGQAKVLALRMTNQGLPSEARPHPTESGKWMIAAVDEDAKVQPTIESAPSKPRKLSGNLKNDLDIIAPGLYGEVAKGGDGEANDARWGDVSLIAEKLRDEQGYMLPRDASGQELANDLRELIRQHAGGGTVLNESRAAQAMAIEEAKRIRQETLRLADEYSIPTKNKGIWRKNEDVLNDVEAAIKKEIGLYGGKIAAITKDGIAAGAFTAAEAKQLAVDIASGYRGDQKRDARVVMYRGIAEKLQERINEHESAASRETGARSGEGAGTAAEDEARPTFDLAGQSEAEARADEERIAAAEAQAREEEARAAAAERQARIDAEVASRQDVAADNFTLDAQVNDQAAQRAADKKRIDDQLAGQGDLLSAPQPKTIAEASLGDLLRAAADKADGKAASEGKPVATKETAVSPVADQIRKIMGLTQAKIDAYDPGQSVEKSGGKWSFTTYEGNSHQAMFDTRKEAVETAVRHKQLKQEQFNDPESFWDITSLLADRRSKLIDQYMRDGMSEMAAGKRAQQETPNDWTPNQGKGNAASLPSEAAKEKFANNGDGLNDAERELRDASHADEQPGDVLLGNRKYVAFDLAVRLAREGIESGAFKAVPAQLNFRLDMAMRDVDRVLAAATGKVGAGETANKPDTGIAFNSLESPQSAAITRALAQESEQPTDTQRGAGWLKIKLRQAQHKGELSAKAVEMVEWLVKQNPALVKYLAVAVENPKGFAEGFNAVSPAPTFSAVDMESAEFKAWFGDSKVVDAEGNPLRVFHGTKGDFSAFELERETENSSTFGAYKTERLGLFFAEEPSFSDEFARQGDKRHAGAKVMPLYLSIKNPLDLTEGFQGLHKNDFDKIHGSFIKDNYWAVNLNADEIWELFDRGTVGAEDFIAAIKDAGFDGVKMIERNAEKEATDVWVALNPAQAKSAISNTGAFDPTNPDIRYDRPTGAAGNYNPFTQVMTLFKGNASDTTAVHEILHHLERMMPAEMQTEIRKEWRKAATKELLAAMKAKDQPRIDYFKAVMAGDQKKATELLTGKGMGGFNAPAVTRMTEATAREAGFTMVAYRGVSKASPFNDTGTTWLSTDREVAEAYAEEVMGYDDPGVIKVMVKPDGLAVSDMRKVSDEQREAMEPDGFGNPQKIGIYRNSDDHPLGSYSKGVTVIHAPMDAVVVVDENAVEPAPTFKAVDTESAEFKRWFGDSKVVDAGGKPLRVYHSTNNDWDTFDPRKGLSSFGFHAGTKEQADAVRETGGTQADLAAQRPTDGMNFMQVFLSLQNPLRMKDGGAWYSHQMVEDLAKLGIEDTAALPQDARERAGYGASHMSIAWDRSSEARKRWDVAVKDHMKKWREQNPDAGRDAYDEESRFAGREYVRGLIEKAGYDGIIYDNKFEGGGDSYIAFRPEQIKSATSNTGKFDTANPDIRQDLAIGQDYQYLNPSEFWAVRMTSTAQARFEAKSIWARSLQWLREALEHIKGAIGLKSDHPLLKALDDLIARGTGEFVSKEMLGSSEVYASIEKIIDDNNRKRTPEQLAMFKRVGRTVEIPTVAERAKAFRQDFWKKAAQGLVDQFAPIKELSKDAYMLMRQSKGATGAFEVFMRGGRLKLTDNTYDFDDTKKGGVIDRLLTPLQNESGDFMWWVAANRAGTLREEHVKAQAKADQLQADADLLTAKARDLDRQAKDQLQQAGNFPKAMTGNQNAQKQNAKDANQLFAEAKGLRADAEELRQEAGELRSLNRERLFTDDDVTAGKSLSSGVTEFDYTLLHDTLGKKAGTVTRDRSLIYRDSLKTFNEFHKNALDMAEQSGLIDPASRAIWEKDFYIPFYRVNDEEGFRGMSVKSGAVRQEAFKQLKGGADKLNSDLLENALMNWAHLIDAAAKNRAAGATIDAAVKLGIAQEVPAGTKGAVWVQEGGKKKHYTISDPYILTALTSLEYVGLRGGVMDALSATKHWLTIGVTASPFFKVRNLIRDSIQVIGTSDISYNPAKNLAEGFKATKRGTDEYFRMLAGGGLIRFGTTLEGNEASRTRALVEKGVDPSTILDNESKVKAFYKRTLEPLIEAYNELGNRGEEINRAALYKQLRAQGVSHLEASFEARDLMDFSMQGSWTGIRFLTQTVPFMNARLQGLYKLGKAAKKDPARMATVVGAAAMISLGLLAAYGDDDDWKKREEWDRNNYWWFKAGGIAYRIPKPFEVGAIATMAERTAEWMFDDEMNGARFAKQFRQVLGDQLAMNPTPQAFKPLIDLYANKDSFSGRPIETMGMEKLDPEYRFRQGTSMIARGISTAGNAVAKTAGMDFLSPVQVDHLVRGYFSWLGAFVVGGADLAVRAASNEPTRPAIDYWKTATGSMVSETSSASSRYVSQMYEQAKELEEAHGTWRNLMKEGKTAEAAEYRADNRDKLNRYRSVEAVKRKESQLNNQIRLIERSSMDPETKKVRINTLRARQNDVAKALSMRTAR